VIEELLPGDATVEQGVQQREVADTSTTRSFRFRKLPVRLSPIIAAVWLLRLGSAAVAHEGHQHAEPEPAVAVPATGEALSVSGLGSSYEAVLKYPAFRAGNSVPVTLFLLSAVTNEPVGGATVKGTLSAGDSSVEVAFAEVEGGLAGDYRATVTPTGAGPWSWLLDITVGEEMDLIGIAAFSAGEPSGAAPENGETPGTHDHGAQMLGAVGAAVVALIAGVLLGRSTAGRATA